MPSLWAEAGSASPSLSLPFQAAMVMVWSSRRRRAVRAPLGGVSPATANPSALAPPPDASSLL